MTMLRHDMLDNSPSVDHAIIDLPLEVKAGGLPGEFEGYGAVFGNTDRDGDIVAKGAFANSLKERLPALLWQHNAKEPIGRFDVVREDERGLFVKGRLAQSGRGAEAYELLKMGALNGLSIGFVTKEAMRNSAAGTRTIKRAELMEVSLVTFPANELARVQTVKQRNAAMNLGMDTNFETGDINDPRTFERFLREQGFSRNRAKAITAKGFRGNRDRVEIIDLVTSVKQRQCRLETKRSVESLLTLFESARTPLRRVSVFPGKEKTFDIGHVRLGRVTFEISAPSWARFTCFINYYDFSGSRPRRRQIKLTDQITSRSVDRGKPPVFNPFNPRHWKEQFPEQLVLDGTNATLVHHEHEDSSIADLVQNQGHFTISVR